jgi:asparagine synthase (glutamine-hydrolysing)
MCGLSGFVQRQPSTEGALQELALQMANAIAHRGPDDAGVWADASAGVALSHRRLSIVDLSPAGHQPMVSRGGRYVMVFNGEIYNHQDIRNGLQALGAAPAWRGHSDTETLLAAVEHWGIERTLQKTVGMFAIALWDRAEHTLVLARDRFGEKPLYYGWIGAGAGTAFAFGSELKALRAHPDFANPVCRQALMQYFRFMYVPAPRSIYKDVYKLEPGCLLTLRTDVPTHAPGQPLRPGQTHAGVSVQRWWSLAGVVEQGAKQTLTDEREAVDGLEQRMREAVQLQSIADVPLGAFLSGGVDSSAVVALMQKQAGRPVKTFTIGFHEQGFDEAPHAAAVARHLGTEHTAFYVTAAQAQQVIPGLPKMYDEPFADSSQIPTHLVCRAARQHVTVALSGDAGDELFGGYNRYFWGPRIWSKLSWMPFPMRRALGQVLQAVPMSAWDTWGAYKPGSGGVARMGDKVHKLARRLRSVHDLDDLYRSLVSEWEDPASLVLSQGPDALEEPPSLLDDPLPALGMDSAQHRMMYRDAMTYLSDDILCKVDRAAMATSLETRVPLLDHRVAEWAWQMPLSMKMRGHEGKWALRQVLYRHVPRELIERPKAGFGIPVGQWLRTDLRDWAEGLLDEATLSQQGYLNVRQVRERWQEHLGGASDHTHSLWAVLMWQAWLRDGEAAS